MRDLTSLSLIKPSQHLALFHQASVSFSPSLSSVCFMQPSVFLSLLQAFSKPSLVAAHILLLSSKAADSFSGAVPQFDPRAKPQKKPVSEPRNFLINPSPKGSGYGYPGVTLSSKERSSPGPVCTAFVIRQPAFDHPPAGFVKT